MTTKPEQIQLDKGPSGGRYSYPFPDGTAAEMVYASAPAW